MAAEPSVARVPKVLVAGATGVVGQAALEHFATLDGWDVIGVSRRDPRVAGAIHLPLDLLDGDACRAAVDEHLTDVTHLVYAALFEKPGLLQGWYEQDQMDTNLSMLRNLLDPLATKATGLEHVSLLQGTKAYGAHVGELVQPGKERAPRHPHANFYWLQEDHLRDLRARHEWTLTIFRPQVVFGAALGSNMNAIPAIGVYAALLKDAGEPLHHPGGAGYVIEATDAGLLARALAWAATSPEARDETFNVTNGDVFTMRGVWPAIAAALEMDVGDDVPLSLSASMPAREREWAALCERRDLAAPRTFDAFVGQGFVYADLFLGPFRDVPPPPALVSTIKIRQAGFGDCLDTEDMFTALFERFRRERLLP
jgi:nucleoside-diphosphate-sugar epimerase